MVEVSVSGAVRRTIYCRNFRQNTDRMARTVHNVALSRTFVRSVLLQAIDRHGMDTDRSQKYRTLMDRVGMWRSLQVFLLRDGNRGRYFTSCFPDGLYCWVKCASACIPLPGQYPYTWQATISTPTGVSAGAAHNGVRRGGVGGHNGPRRRLPTPRPRAPSSGPPPRAKAAASASSLW
jgi:hypothetical protein